MIKPIRQIGVFLLFCSYVFPTYGQQEGNYVRGMFDELADLEWIRSMDGTVNDLHPIEVSLGYDGSAYKGKLTILDDNSAFDLIGEMDGDRLVLQEIDSEGLHTGYLIGALEDDRFTGQWWSTDMSRSADLRLMESDLVILKIFKPRMLKLEGMAGEERFDCILMAETTGVISGTWQRENECIRMIGQCEDLLCTSLELVASEGEMSGTHVFLSMENDKTFRVDVDNVGIPQYGKVEIVDDVKLHRRAKSDYSTIIDFTYPEIDDGNFNTWIEGRFSDWFDATLSYFAQEDGAGPESRWSQSASGWMDVFLYTDHLVSGLITYYNPERKNYDREYFIYSTDEARELTLEELSKKDRNLLTELQNKIHIDGVSSNEFIYPVLTRSGFFVCTEFDAVEGDYSAMVSYDAVEKAVKRKAFFTKLEE